MSDITVIKETDIILESRDDINNNFANLKSNFAGSDYPILPVEGMSIFKDSSWETYKNGSWVPDGSLHNHDEVYYAKTETDNFLSKKSDETHTHDSRYYTESESDSLLSGKANLSHTHDSRYYTESEVNNKLATKAETSLVNALSNKVSGIETNLAGKSNSNHRHSISEMGLGTAAEVNTGTSVGDVPLIGAGNVIPYSLLQNYELTLRWSGTATSAYIGNETGNFVVISRITASHGSNVYYTSNIYVYSSYHDAYPNIVYDDSSATKTDNPVGRFAYWKGGGSFSFIVKNPASFGTNPIIVRIYKWKF